VVLCTYCASPAAPVGDFCMESGFVHLLCWSGCTLRRLLHGGWFCALIVLVRLHPWTTSARRVFWKRLRFFVPIILAAPLGDFCTESLLEKTSMLHTYCASPAAPLGDFCAECRTRGWPALPLAVTSMWSNAEDRRCGFFRHCLNFCGGFLRVYYMAPPH
jgi:hypothetical protein